MPTTQRKKSPAPTGFDLITDLSKKWGRHPSAFVRDIRDGRYDKTTGEFVKLPAIFCGGRWLVRKGDFDTYCQRLTAMRTGAPMPATRDDAEARAERLQQANADLEAMGVR